MEDPFVLSVTHFNFGNSSQRVSLLCLCEASYLLHRSVGIVNKESRQLGQCGWEREREREGKKG